MKKITKLRKTQKTRKNVKIRKLPEMKNYEICGFWISAGNAPKMSKLPEIYRKWPQSDVSMEHHVISFFRNLTSYSNRYAYLSS